MRKFYKFTKSSAEDRRQELLDFVEKYNKKYNSYNTVMDFIRGLDTIYLARYDGFEFEDEETSQDSWMWGHGSLVKYRLNLHKLVNDNIDLGKL